MHILPLSGSADIPNDCNMISGSISGGYYPDYLREQMQCFDGKVCLCLDAAAVLIYLPSYDGQGEILSQKELNDHINNNNSRFSKALCCNYIFISKPATVILFDDELSLQKKLQYAKEAAVPYVLLPDKYIKSKTP